MTAVRSVDGPGVHDRRPKEFDGYERSSVYVPMRDGVRIAVDIVRPTAGGQFHDGALPVLWSHTPYTRAVEGPDGVEPAPIEGWERMLLLVEHGYVVVLVDKRGAGASFGASDAFFNIDESRDAYEITEWLAEQAWSNGRIGMWGRSYLGITQLLCAGQKPPHLQAIFPEMAWWDAYEIIWPGGILRDDLAAMWSAGVRSLDLGIPALSETFRGDEAISWPAAPVDADLDGSLIRSARREHFANRDVFEFCTSNPFKDSAEAGRQVWADRSPSAQAAAIEESGVAIYHYVGWYDGFTRDACLAFSTLSNPQKLLIDASYHAEYGAFDLAGEQLRWFDHWLKDIDTGIMDEPAVMFYELGADPADPWRSSPSWPPLGSEMTPMHFAPGPSGTVASVNDGTLLSEILDDGSDTYVIDESTTTGLANRFSNLYGGPGRVTPINEAIHLGYPDLASNDAKGLTYTAAPLDADLHMAGHPRAHVWIETDADVPVFVYLEEVLLDGFSRYLSEGCRRISHRVGGGANEVAAPEAGAMELVIDMQPVGTVLRPGSRLRVTITCADQAAHAPANFDPPPTIKVLLGGDTNSHIELPFYKGATT